MGLTLSRSASKNWIENLWAIILLDVYSQNKSWFCAKKIYVCGRGIRRSIEHRLIQFFFLSLH